MKNSPFSDDAEKVLERAFGLRDIKRMQEIIFSVDEAPEGGFVAKALGASIFTEADNLEDLHEKVRDAVRCHFKEGKEPKVIRLHFVREEVLAV